MKKTTLGGNGQTRRIRQPESDSAESDGQERSNKIARRIQSLLNSGYKCVSQARCQAKAMIDNPNYNWLQESELDKIKAECKDKCCNPCTNELHCHESQEFVDRVNTTIRSSSAIRGSTNTTISEAATEHSLVRELLALANENPRRTPSTIPQAACQKAKRPRKYGKGISAHARTKSPDPKDVAG